MLQNVGLGKLKPNILVLGFKDDWRTAQLKSVEEYIDVIHDAFDYNYSVAILRLPKGTHLEEDSDWEGELTDGGESDMEHLNSNSKASVELKKPQSKEAVTTLAVNDTADESDTPASTPVLSRDCEKGLLSKESTPSKKKNAEGQKKFKDHVMSPLTEKRKGKWIYILKFSIMK